MKKILLGVATVFMAVSTQAAAIGWNSGPLYAPDSETGAYTTIAGTGASFSAIVTFYTFDGEATYTEFTTTGNSNSVTSKGGVVQGVTAENFKANTTYYATIYITDPTGKWYLSNTSYTPIIVPDSGPGTVLWDFGTTGKWEPIPEPATLALLGLGVMALGLRRRRK